ncbi:Hypothetical predicted protein [Pelobates cultripes]|uniref:Uncharacterized protein n=1 Tax=Pelobates cultripes TaxID=61616 RepID=A0AAD1SM54_PELCU|nr:Hypothetical predicted protein [Pelobates cultripes]
MALHTIEATPSLPHNSRSMLEMPANQQYNYTYMVDMPRDLQILDANLGCDIPDSPEEHSVTPRHVPIFPPTLEHAKTRKNTSIPPHHSSEPTYPGPMETISNTHHTGMDTKG